MKRNILIGFVLLIVMYSCQKKEKVNIKTIASSNIVGDFDSNKYPKIQTAIELGYAERREEAIDKFNEAENEYGQSVIIALNRGIIFKELGDYDLAIKDYTLCLKINPNYYPALINRGILNGNLENFDKAIKDLNKAIELNSEYPIGYLNRAFIYSKMNNRELACKDLLKAKQKDIEKKFEKDIEELEQENCE
ncbi:tetratricopeptide repeat protein [Flavobacterium stagni]|uniref:Tetratricopeptide repeat protein n=1 Tax=Flavobacterium stagni TaxID=2506421 RepID=A0A4Q1K397_9FLAO|nr:tetratricopeptide repeat protein [Flavobacterium stagni]RXR20253.1 tetratricopeptide repeat protein [Flavobacterium stagni]